MPDKKCFIIMPISTPSDLVDTYSNDMDHFKHVLDFLFVPAIEKVGMIPIPPKTKGSEIIQAEIISNIESAEFVLCDMSTLNANVFFELGIRTAVNKPVALVKDDITERVPFDTHIINNHTYLHSLNPWELDLEIKKLAEHLGSCCSSTETVNSLWKYFSLSSRAVPLEKEMGGEDKMEYLTMQVAALRQELEQSRLESYDRRRKGSLVKPRGHRVFEQLQDIAGEEGVHIIAGAISEDILNITIPIMTPLSPSFENRLAMVAASQGFTLGIEYTKQEKDQQL